MVGVDTDPQALEATQVNAERNNVQIATYLPQDCPNENADVVLANILAGPLQTLAPILARLCRPCADIILSGILESQADIVSSCYQSTFTMQSPTQKEEWVRLVGRRND